MRRSRFLTTSASVTATLGSPGVSRAAAPHTGEPLQTVPDHYAKLEAFLSFLQERNTSQYARIPAGGIYEESYVRIGGIDQWVTIHGDNQANPILLFVHGGPGDVTNPWTFVLFRSWRRHFTIVQWDQRGAGKTLGRSGPDIAPTITIDRMVQDGLELTEYLCSKLRKPKIIVVAHSFGTILGLLMIGKMPDRYVAYIGTGQVADSTKNYSVAYAELLRYARAMGNIEAVEELMRAGPPPYSSGTGYQVQRKWSNAFEGADEFLPGTIGLKLTAPGGGVQAVVDEADGELLSANGLVPQTRILTEQDLGFDFRLPVFFVQGAIDFTTPTVAARNYFNLISAPQKAFVTIPSGGHFSVFIHCDAFLNRVVGLLGPCNSQSRKRSEVRACGLLEEIYVERHPMRLSTGRVW